MTCERHKFLDIDDHVFCEVCGDPPSAEQLAKIVANRDTIERLRTQRDTYAARVVELEARLAHEPSARRDVLTLHGFEIISLVQCLGGEPDCDVSIAHFEAAKDAETGEDMPAGHYAWFTEYPEEGRLYLSTEPPSAHDDGDAIVGPAATAGEVLADLKALEAGSCAVHGQGACICLGARYWMDRAQAAERAAQPPAAEQRAALQRIRAIANDSAVAPMKVRLQQILELADAACSTATKGEGRK